MKKSILAGLVVAWMLAIPISGFALQTIDTTHLNLDPREEGKTLGCAECHFSFDTNTNNEIVASNTCAGCHKLKTTSGDYTDGSAPLAESHFGLRCSACHNPHVSLQYENVALAGKKALVKGNITGKTVNPGEIIFNVTATAGDWDANATLWDSKTLPGRGLIFWVSQSNGEDDCGTTTLHYENLDNISFEVTYAADNGTLIKVKDRENVGASITATSFEMHYGQLMATAMRQTNPNARKYDYLDANATTDAVDFPAMDNTGLIAGNFFVNADGSGICQNCHEPWNGLTGPRGSGVGAKTGTIYWNNDGTNQTHNPQKVCTTCHNHSASAAPSYGFGLGKDCILCHPNYGDQNNPDLGNPPTSGAHMKHAGKGAGQYGYDCQVCHKGGMTDWNLAVKKDTLVQIGFNLIPNGTAAKFSGAGTAYDGATSGTYPDLPFAPEGDTETTYGLSYDVGQNDTLVTTTGTMKCSNVYCHSDGYASGYMSHADNKEGATRCATSTTSSSSQASHLPNVTPPWTGSWAANDPQGDSDTCNNCHQVSGLISKGNAGWTGHSKHGNKCGTCHYATTGGANINYPPITSTQYHANGVVNILLHPDYGAGSKIVYDPTLHTCAITGVAGCHTEGDVRTWPTLNSNPVGAVDDIACANVAPDVNIMPYVESVSRNLGNNFVIVQDHSYDPDYIDPNKAKGWGGVSNPGGAHAGRPGFISVNWNNEITEYQEIYITDEPGGNGYHEIGHNFLDTSLLVSHGGEAWFDSSIHDIGHNVAWWEYRLLDNACNNSAFPGAPGYPASLTWGKCLDVLGAKTSLERGWGHVKEDDIFGWQVHYFTTPNPTDNIPLIIPTTHDLTVTGTNTVTLSDTVIDPDAIDAAKHAHFEQLYPGAGGHDGSPGKISINFNMNPANQIINQDIVFTNTGTPMSFTATYPEAYIARGNPAAPGCANYWVVYDVQDNNPEAVMQNSGWFRYVDLADPGCL